MKHTTVSSLRVLGGNFELLLFYETGEFQRRYLRNRLFVAFWARIAGFACSTLFMRTYRNSFHLLGDGESGAHCPPRRRSESTVSGILFSKCSLKQLLHEERIELRRKKHAKQTMPMNFKCFSCLCVRQRYSCVPLICMNSADLMVTSGPESRSSHHFVIELVARALAPRERERVPKNPLRRFTTLSVCPCEKAATAT